MRQKAYLFAILNILILIVSVSSVAQQDRSDSTDKCGASVDRIALCLRHSSEPGNLILELKNVGPRDEVLNLGIMLANGARQYPSAITLTLIDSAGVVHKGVLAEPGSVAGRVDPFIVPLPQGASLVLPIDLRKYLLYDAGRFEDLRPDPTKRYRVQAEFTGKDVTQREANLDSKAVALMPFWTHVTISNSITINQGSK